MKQLITIIALLLAANSFAQTLAFPCATGPGAYVTGGRGYPVYKVTNLNDNGSGSFRQALIDASNNGGGNIVFDVSGTVMLTNRLFVYLDNVTIAGQTAPAPGITIGGTGDVFMESFNNSIIRYVKFRQQLPTNRDNITFYRTDNFIMDHCSLMGGTDEGSDATYQVEKGTVQYCMFGMSKTGMLLGDSNDASTMTEGSFNNNVIYNTSHRFPNPSSDGRIDIINNLVWNNTFRLSVMIGSADLNHINNYYDSKYGTLDENPVNYRLNGVGGCNNDWCVDNYNYWGLKGMLLIHDGTNNPSIYTSGNIMRNNPYVNNNNWNMWRWRFYPNNYNNDNGGAILPTVFQANTAFPQVGESFTIRTAQQIKDNLIYEAGANKTLGSNGNIINNVDTIDQKILNEVSTNTQDYYNTGNFSDAETQYIRDYWATLNNTPIATRTDDTNGDGIPEPWFLANVPLGQNYNDTTPEGYTWLEEYMNQVDTCGQTPIANTCSGKNPPLASLTNPLSGSYLKSDTLNFGVSYTADTTVTSVAYYIDGNLLANTTTPFTHSATNFAQGVYEAYAVVTDACGKSSNTDTVSVTINGIQVVACIISTTPVIDGTEDAMWSTIPSQLLGVTENGLIFPDSMDLSANYKIAWDATSLYLFVKVIDDTLIMDSPQLDFFRDDAVSIFIDATDNNSLTYDSDDYYIGMKQGNTDIIVNNVVYLGSGIARSVALTANGYNMEIKIDWAFIGVTPTVGSDIGLDLRVDDDNDGGPGRENHVLWNDETSTLWNNPSKFGILKLVNTNCNNTTNIDVKNQDDLTVYPNPTNGELTITSSNFITKVEVYNALGGLVLTKAKVNSKTKELSLSNLPKGVYSIKVYVNNRVVEKQIIKQ